MLRELNWSFAGSKFPSKRLQTVNTVLYGGNYITPIHNLVQLHQIVVVLEYIHSRVSSSLSGRSLSGRSSSVRFLSANLNEDLHDAATI